MQAWMLFTASVIVVWIVSLCKILHAAYFPSMDLRFRNGQLSGKKNILLVTAHPDDESMFFTPTLNYLTSRGHDVHIVCLSTGNSDGMGSTRKDELCNACAVLKVPLRQVKVIDHMDLQDGFGKVWNHTLVAEIVEEEINSHDIDLVITFDRYGVSGHCNHRDVHFGIRKLLIHFEQRKLEAWELVSTNLPRKYSGPVDIWLTMISGIAYQKTEVLCLQNENPLRSYLAMAQHASQWVWFRKLFVCLSSYTYVNTLRKIEV